MAAQNDGVVQFCECDSWDCQLSITLPNQTVIEIKQAKLIIIVDGCLTGLSLLDQLIETRQGYKLYKDLR